MSHACQPTVPETGQGDTSWGPQTWACNFILCRHVTYDIPSNLVRISYPVS